MSDLRYQYPAAKAFERLYHVHLRDMVLDRDKLEPNRIFDDESRSPAALPLIMTPTVRLSPEFVSRVSDLIGRIGASEIKAGTEILGPLFGTTQDGLVTVQTFRVVPVHDLRIGRQEYFGRAFERLLAVSKTDPELAVLEVIGWCCIRSMESKGLLESDTAFHNHRFPGATGIVLLFRPDPQTGVSVELYSRSPNGTISRDECCWAAATIALGTPATAPIELSMGPNTSNDAGLALTKAPDFRDKTETEGLLPPSDSEASPLSPLFRIRAALSTISLPQARLSWISAFLVLAVAAGATFLGIRLHANSSSVVASAPAAAPAAASPSRVGMKVEAQQGDRLLVTWNPESPIVQSAKYGILYIDDGPQHKEVDFAPGEMRGGSILYRPASDEVTFRLQVLGRDDALTTESVRVLDGALAVAMNANAQKLQLHAAATPLISPAKKSPPPTGQVVADHVETEQESPNLASGIVENKSLPQQGVSITPPPKLSIATAPHSGETYDSLPPAPLPPASPTPAKPKVTARLSTTTLPRPLRQVLPDTRGIGASVISTVGELEVDVSIDEAGHVSGARLINRGSYLPKDLGEAALRAAKQWIFAPARMHGKPIASNHTIVFKFQSPAQ